MKPRNIIVLAICGWVQLQTAAAQWSLTAGQKELLASLTNVLNPRHEQDAMIIYVNHRSLAYQAAMIQKMLEEANYFADRLKLPTKRPIQITDVRHPAIPAPWFCVIRDEKVIPNEIVSRFGTNIFNTSIPRETRLRALMFGTHGYIETTNFAFFFEDGRLREVTRLSSNNHDAEYYSDNLDALVGKPSLIDTNGAYQLATQWLAAVDVDMPALNKLKWTVNQLHYKARGATNYVTLPLFYVDFGNKHTPASGNLHAFDEPLVSVEVLGTTKELQDLEIKDLSFSRRPLLIISNALDLIRTPDPKVKQLRVLPNVETNSTSH